MVRPRAWAVFWTTPCLQSSPILSLELLLEFIEEAPVGALGGATIGMARAHLALSHVMKAAGSAGTIGVYCEERSAHTPGESG
jgi:hypothetical protein